MAFFAVAAFLSGSLFQIFFLLRQPEGHYHFPFFAIVTSTFYFGTQLILFFRFSNGDFSAEITIFALFALVVNIVLHVGFWHGSQCRSYRGITAQETKIRTIFPFLLHFLLLVLGVTAFVKLASLAGGVSAFFSTAGAGIVWEGRAVQYTFAVQTLYIVYPICLFIWGATKRRAFLVLGVCALVLPLLYAALLNRRFVFFLLATSVYLFFFFQYRLVVKKFIIISAVPIALCVVTLFPFLRSSLSLRDAIAAKGLSGIELIIGQNFVEVRNGVLSLMSSLQNAEYDYGLGFFRQIFKDFVPSSIVGREVKAQIIGEDGLRELVYSDYFFDIPSHEFITGIAEGFYQLGFLSLILWYVIGRYFGFLWKRARYQGNLKDQIIYTTMIPTGMMALYYAPAPALSQAIKIWVIVYITFTFTRFILRSNSTRLPF